MSSPERALPRRRKAARRAACAAALMGLAAIGGGCTVQPLYSQAVQVSAYGDMAATLATISVDPVSTREALEVRNQLIFLLSGGQGNPAQPAYALNLVVTSSSSAAASIQVSTTEQSPTSSLLNMNAYYRLRDLATGKVVATGSRQISAAYDVPRQQYAALRAERDAQDRAAREIAEQLRLAVAQDLSRAR
jgi:LPS-assembly lipoprotein